MYTLSVCGLGAADIYVHKQIERKMQMPRLLIVDDEEKIREVVKENALIEGYEVEEAADGMQAIEKVYSDNSGLDCIVMDIMMPRLDGYSACKEIKKLSSEPDIMLSARGEEYDMLELRVGDIEDAWENFVEDQEKTRD